MRDVLLVETNEVPPIGCDEHPALLMGKGRDGGVRHGLAVQNEALEDHVEGTLRLLSPYDSQLL